MTAARGDGATIVERARSCIGARFRAQGRDPAHGLDCVGLEAFAIGRDVQGDYSMRLGDADLICALIARAGLARVAVARAGDLIGFRSAAGQVHLAIYTDDGIIHADAVARRVVARPGPMPWPVLGIWRAEGE